ncbi:MAG: heavy metal-binding domain-containing protein [Chryseolinea sp.]
MKKSIVSFAFLFAGLFVAVALITSCGKKAEQATEEHHHAGSDTTNHHEGMPMDSTQIVYACSMHPEVTGKKGDKCSKCGMALEAVKDTHEH